MKIRFETPSHEPVAIPEQLQPEIHAEPGFPEMPGAVESLELPAEFADPGAAALLEGAMPEAEELAKV